MLKIDDFECWLEDGETGERFEEYQTQVIKDGNLGIHNRHLGRRQNLRCQCCGYRRRRDI
jgi:hypothetical protein